jgi:hypothetical protein
MVKHPLSSREWTMIAVLIVFVSWIYFPEMVLGRSRKQAAYCMATNGEYTPTMIGPGQYVCRYYEIERMDAEVNKVLKR